MFTEGEKTPWIVSKVRSVHSLFSAMLTPKSTSVSADLIELGRTPIAVVSSGCKSFLDIPRTLEFLETQGVTVATFADGREGNVDLPAFWTRDSGVPSPMVVQDEEEAAAVFCK